MSDKRTYSKAHDLLKRAELRPTRQRLALCRLLFESGNRHVTAELVHSEALAAGIPVSLATVYNALHQFKDVGLLKEVVVDGGKTYFDTNMSEHHHFFVEEEGCLIDIAGEDITVTGIPEAPEGMEISRTDIIVRVNLRQKTV